MTEPPRPTIGSIQLLRAAAALAVVLYHTQLILSQAGGGVSDFSGSFADFGWVGVNAFFVVSGFVIFIAHRHDFGTPSALPNYLWRRFVRIYPVYWLCLTAYIAAAWFGLGSPDFEWDSSNLLAAYFLVDTGLSQTLPLKVAWTLLYELRFYLIFALFLLSPRVGAFAMGLWLLLIFLANILWADWQISALNIWNIYFFCGMACAYALPRVPQRSGASLMLIGATILLVSLANLAPSISAGQQQTAPMLALAVGFSLLVLGAALLERRVAWQLPNWVSLLGEASYSIYLIHSAVLSVVALAAARFNSFGLPDKSLFWLAFFISTFAGVIFHLTIERPLLRWLKGPPKLPASASRQLPP